MLHREPCTSITNTCGKCLSGYVGEIGSFNTICVPYAEVTRRRKLREEETSRHGFSLQADCIAPGLCSDTLKSCPNDCSNHGICIFLDRNGHNDTMANGFSGMDACYVGNKYCKAKCHCDNNYYGEDCSLDFSTYNAKIALRDSL